MTVVRQPQPLSLLPNLHLNLLRFGLLFFWEEDSQDAILVARLDLLEVNSCGEAEGSANNSLVWDREKLWLFKALVVANVVSFSNTVGQCFPAPQLNRLNC
jgi:hypothetical protein